MTDRIAITARERIREATALPVVARFRSANADAAPTTAKYRLDDQDGSGLIDWTGLTPATSVSFTIPASANVCRTCLPVERRDLVVMADEGLATQYVERITYEVENIRRIP